jgi:nucleoside triphosphate diphosphatase
MAKDNHDNINQNTIEGLLAIMKVLRTPKTGCPWDLEQDFKSIAPFTIEEAYEVADAIERNDMSDLQDELGDLLLQVVYHSQMASETNAFDFEDVTRSICKKMIRRHPHVFANDSLESQQAVVGMWENIKAQEREQKLKQEKKGALTNVPHALPALMRAVKLQNRAARVGFDWPNIKPVFDKVNEEIDELKQAITNNDTASIQEEYGDLLFVMANLARHLSIDPETALRQANLKFTRRFEGVEAKLEAQGKTLALSNLSEMDILWNEVKQEE